MRELNLIESSVMKQTNGMRSQIESGVQQVVFTVELEKLRHAYEKSIWISVDDQLPLNNNEVEIAFFDGCYMCRIFGAYEASNWWLGDEILEDVTHWREATPLPELPKEFDYDW